MMKWNCYCDNCLSVCWNDRYGGDTQDILNNNEHTPIK